MTITTLNTPAGTFALSGGPAGLRAVHFPDEARDSEPVAGDAPALLDARNQLDEYFRGERRTFELRLDVDGTPLQRAVWDALIAIPYGQTTTYRALAAQIASELGRVSVHPRAVGGAVARTPIPIVIPCHRAIGSDGSLTGYRGGIPLKRALLAFEASDGDPGALRDALTMRQAALV